MICENFKDWLYQSCIERDKEEREKSEKICSVCRKMVLPPIQWWGEPYNSCSECVKKAAKEIQEDERETLEEAERIKSETFYEEEGYKEYKEKQREAEDKLRCQ